MPRSLYSVIVVAQIASYNHYMSIHMSILCLCPMYIHMSILCLCPMYIHMSILCLCPMYIHMSIPCLCPMYIHMSILLPPVRTTLRGSKIDLFVCVVPFLQNRFFEVRAFQRYVVLLLWTMLYDLTSALQNKAFRPELQELPSYY